MKNFRGSPRHIAWIAALLAAIPALRADHSDFVIISASASKTYTQHKFVDGVPQRQTYALFQGKFFDGETRDPSVDHSTLIAIAKVLAPDLAKQNYFPAPAAASADLLIVVNWGTTVTDSSHMPPPTTDDEYRQSTMNYNSSLLGYQGPLLHESHMDWATPSGMNAMEESHFSELIDERYFVILLAYDYQKILRESRAYQALLVQHPREARQLGPPPQPKPVWSVRMNVRAAGNNFTEALPAMSEAASTYFGRQEDDLVDQPAAIGSHAHVDVGPTQVLGPAK